MTDKEQKTAAKKFTEYWKNKGDEKSDTQSFWFMLLREIFGIQEPEKCLNLKSVLKMKLLILLIVT